MLGSALRKGLVISHNQEWRDAIFGSRPTASGVRVSPESAMAAASVYSATSLIASTIASLPVKIMLRDDVSRIPQRPLIARTLWTGRPNAQQTTTSFVETIVLSMLLWGNAYVFPRRDSSGVAVELWPVDPDRVVSVHSFPVNDTVGIRYEVNDLGVYENLPGERPQIIHIPLLVTPGRIKGISPVERLAELIGMSLSSQEHAARFLGQGVHMSGTIEAPGSLKREQARELAEGFSALHSGPQNAGRVGVLTGGATFKPVMMPPEELQFLQQMQYSDRKIASIYRVPPHMIGDVERSTSWGKGIEEMAIEFRQYTLLPLIRKLEEAFETGLLAGTNYSVKFATDGLLRGNTAARTAYYQGMFGIGVLSADEIRSLEDMAPQPDGVGQEYYRPLNYTPVGQEVPA